MKVEDEKATMLANAAPELLEALEGMVAAYGCECLDTEPEPHCPMCIARKVIAKAKGETT